MADWYTSSTAYAAIAAFVPSAVYTLGQICKPTAPAVKAMWAMRCTTAGTASTEPGWNGANNGTSTSGGATFTNVTGQSTYGWSAAAGDIPTLLGAVGPIRFVAGDRMFVSSDHSETQSTTTTYGSSGTASWSVGQVLSVNRAGSVPPVPADMTAGATVTVGTTGISMTLEALFPIYFYGLNFVYTGTSANAIAFNGSGTKMLFFDGCLLYLNTATAGCKIIATNPASVVLNNTALRFGNIAHCVSAGAVVLDLTWLNTPSAVVAAGTIPTNLFNSPAPLMVTARGVDLSAITTALLNNNNNGAKCLLDSCRIASGVTRYNSTGVNNTRDLVELVNCYDGTNFISESWQPAGAVTTELSITLSGGATDNVGTYSHKMVSGTTVDKYANPLVGFWLDTNYATTGSSKTASVEIVSSASLNNDEISLLLEYEGTSGSSVASFVSSLPPALTTPSAVTSSSATWNALPATPVRQRLSVSFTPRTAGRLRAQVRLGKASTTVYVDPRVTVT